MNLTNYLLTSIAVYLGLIAGIIVSYMSKEELKPGKRYFIIMHNIVLAFILFFILELFNLNIYLIIILILILLISLFSFKEVYKKSYIVYFLLGTIFYLSHKNINYFLIISALIFLYGMPTSALQLDFKKKNYYKVIIKNLLFFICLLLFFI